MHKVANSQELQVELQRILRLASQSNPSRAHLAEELRSLADRVAGMDKLVWTKRGDEWIVRVQHMGESSTHTWSVHEADGKFEANVKFSKGSFKAKKTFASLEQAQRFCMRFANKANGAELLDDVLSKDFVKVN